jgi:membrane associated rhomboid family serine protease
MSNFRYTRPDSFPPLIKNLIIINALVWVAQLLLQDQFELTSKLALWPILPGNLEHYVRNSQGGDFFVGFKPYQIATHFFTHSLKDPFHLIFNMAGLFFFGRTLENVWGPKKFLFFYLASGVGAAALHLTIQYFRAEPLLNAFEHMDQDKIYQYQGALSSAVGASGAVMGVMAASAVLFPNTEAYMMMIPFPIKLKWLVLGWVALDLFGGVAKVPGDNIAHFAHLGGAITGFIIVFIWNKTNRRTLY